jgi:DNA-binding MurR/RpiR family transcriptional regulator
MFYTKLKGVYPSLTASETRVADYILANRGSVSSLTSQQLADALELSQPTIIRFSQKMGYKSYRNLLQDVEKSDDGDEVVEEIQLKDSIAATNEKIKNHIQHLLDVTNELNEPADYEKAIDLIQAAKTIFCYGFLSTGSMADHMNNLLQLFGINSYCMDNYATMSAMRNHGRDGLLIVFSKSGETAVTNEVVRYAKDRGLKVIGVTNMAPNSMSPYLDVWLKVLYSPVKTRFLHYTETTPQMFIIDSLILNLYKRDFPFYSDSVAEHIDITKEARGRQQAEGELWP